MNWLAIVVALWLSLVTVMSAPAPTWWDELFNPSRGYGGNGGYGSRSGGEFNQYPARQGRSGKEKYNALCKVLNPDPYAFPGKIPYPAAPFCP
ncbi:unnamed protein product [Bemisia tabaci]|uniref:Uncharacterized protein n=1 Tax=Bemisia tabaci TaxID=7038 RepID=A0A9P0C8G4_BEMTA|nr:unnamed protein product [Bemisia tabaci]